MCFRNGTIRRTQGFFLHRMFECLFSLQLQTNICKLKITHSEYLAKKMFQIMNQESFFKIHITSVSNFVD